MLSSAQDLQFLTEALPQLQDYLLSNELYWPLSNSLPRLTLGSLWLALARLDSLQPTEAQKLRAQVEPVYTRWRSAWEKKVAHEAVNRLRLWSQFLSDYASDPGQDADRYPTEVRGRVILQLLLREAPDLPENAALAEMDAMLKAYLIPGEFLWTADLQAVFPKPDFWYLYGTLNPALSQKGRGRK
jgi:hypothetical protein